MPAILANLLPPFNQRCPIIVPNTGKVAQENPQVTYTALTPWSAGSFILPLDDTPCGQSPQVAESIPTCAKDDIL